MIAKKDEILQIRRQGINVKDLLDSNFLKSLEKEFKGYTVSPVNLTILIEKEKETEDQISLVHYKKEHNDENILTIDVNEPKSLNKTLKAIDEVK